VSGQFGGYLSGSPAGGFQIIGLFANSADAQSFAEDYSLKDWWVAELISPRCGHQQQSSPDKLRLVAKP
jgi:hypothetical protein